jgi:predicted nucleic acid-binding protein
MRFADTNVLLYSVCADPADAEKASRADNLLMSGDLILSVQVLQEFYVQATRPSRRRKLSHEKAVQFISHWLRFPVQEMTVAMMQAAFSTKVRWHISYRDAAIIESARAAGCDEVLSEDLNAGQDYGGIQVVNPFV